MGKTSTLYAPAAIEVQPALSGQTIAKSHWGPSRRAQLAARWKLGQLKIDHPTTKAAAAMFRVSVPRVMQAIANLEAGNRQPSDAAIERIVRLSPNRVLAALDRFTASKVAAE
jgi:hypothetical protein